MALKNLPNENNLLRKIAEGNQRAFCVLFDHYQKYVFTFGRKLTHSEEMAEEIVQDIFLKIWLNKKKLLTVDNFGAYLNRIVRNHSFNLLRQASIHSRASQEIGLSLTEADNSTQNHLDFKETAKILDEAINILSDQQKKAYILCHQQGLKYEDAALEMNISSATVHYHMKIALQVIRDHLKKNALAYPLLIFHLFK